jgi:GTP-binding protein Era
MSSAHMIHETNTIEKTLKVALIGPPNVGKSTLVNAIVGQKIAITTHKPQTTRSATLGVLTDGDTQMIFADTPGIFAPRKSHRLEKFIVNNAIKAIAKIDIALLLIDAYIIQKIVECGGDISDDKISTKLKAYHEAIEVLFSSTFNKKIIIIANKIDTLQEGFPDLNSEQLSLVYTSILGSHYNAFEKIILPVSAINSTNIDLLISTIKPFAKEKPWEFNPDDCTNTSERALAEEITREQLYLVMHAEIPYSVMIDTDNWEENADGSVSIHQSILVLKQSQKNMIIGAGGKMIKKIGEQSRIAITDAFGRSVHLFLHVKVRQDWIERLKI